MSPPFAAVERSPSTVRGSAVLGDARRCLPAGLLRHGAPHVVEGRLDAGLGDLGDVEQPAVVVHDADEVVLEAVRQGLELHRLFARQFVRIQQVRVVQGQRAPVGDVDGERDVVVGGRRAATSGPGSGSSTDQGPPRLERKASTRSPNCSVVLPRAAGRAGRHLGGQAGAAVLPAGTRSPRWSCTDCGLLASQADVMSTLSHRHGPVQDRAGFVGSPEDADVADRLGHRADRVRKHRLVEDLMSERRDSPGPPRACGPARARARGRSVRSVVTPAPVTVRPSLHTGWKRRRGSGC